jgi:hypothetical protein
VYYGYPGIRIPIGWVIDYPVTIYSTTGNVPIANFNIPLSSNNAYITHRDSAGSSWNAFFNNWDDKFFNPIFQGYPSPGWTIGAFMGFADLGGPPNPNLNAHDSLTVCHFSMSTVNDTNLINQTLNIFVSGQHPYSGPLSFGDPIGGNYTDIHENIYPVTFVACIDSDYVGTGTGVRNNPQNEIFAYCNGGLNFLLKDIIRRASYHPHYYGQMQDSASIYTLKYGVGGMADKDNRWINPNQASGVDAHVYTGMVYDYLMNNLGRNGFDSLGHSMVSIVENPGDSNNARYDSLSGFTFYGTVSPGYKSHAGWLDIVAHEWGHGVTNHCSNLQRTREPGALSDAFSDMLGATIKKVMLSSPRWWIIGDSIDPNGCAVRNMQTPSQPSCNQYYPDTYQGSHWQFPSDSSDQYGVHTNCLVADKMFYLLAAGGTHNGINVQPIGVENAFKVMYKANRRFWSADINFCNAKKKTVEAADTLDISGEWGKWAAAAWNAVGVCPYTVGDANCNGECRGSDLTYLVAFFKGTVSAKPNCICTDVNHTYTAFWVSAEYNGDCQITGADITYGARYFKGLGPAPVPCSLFTPTCP